MHHTHFELYSPPGAIFTIMLLVWLLPCCVVLGRAVCAAGVWVQNRCIAQLQALTVGQDSQCLETKEVFAGQCPSHMHSWLPCLRKC